MVQSRKNTKIDVEVEAKHRRPGRWIGPPPTKADLIRLYVNEERSVREVAAALGCSKDAVYRALGEFRIKTRSCVRRSRLAKMDHGKLFADIAKNGVDATAILWGIPERTLKRYLARIRLEVRHK